MSVTTPEQWLAENIPSDRAQRVHGSIWPRDLFNLLSEAHTCSRQCPGSAKAMHWRPPETHDSCWYLYGYQGMDQWEGKLPPVPSPRDDFTRGPEYPTGHAAPGQPD